MNRISTRATQVFAGLLVGMGLLLTGCDIVGQKQMEDKPLLRVTNDLGERMTVLDGKTVPATVGTTPRKRAFTLKAVSRIDPPNNGQHASHLSVSNDDEDLFVSYAIPGPTFGGGIDILDKSSPTFLSNEDNALRSPDLDVQEVAYQSGSPNNLYVAGAIDFGLIQARDYGNTPAVMIRAQIDDDGNVLTHSDGDVRVVEAAMPNRVVKSVTVAPGAGNGPHSNAAVYAVTDSIALYSFDSGLGNRQVTSLSPNDFEFRSVVAHAGFGKDNVYTLTDEGELWEFANTGTTKRQTFVDLAKKGIARLQTYAHNNAPTVTSRLLYAALNEGGFAVLNASGNQILYENTDQYYVSVSAVDHDVDGSGDVSHVFAAGPGGTIDVFELNSNITSSNTSEGLELTGSFDLGGLEEVGIGSDPLGSGQVNQVLATDDYLYVAAGDEGVVVLEIAENQGDIF